MRRIEAGRVWLYRDCDGRLTADRESSPDFNSAQYRCMSERDYRLLMRLVRAVDRHIYVNTNSNSVEEALIAFNAPRKTK